VGVDRPRERFAGANHVLHTCCEARWNSPGVEAKLHQLTVPQAGLVGASLTSLWLRTHGYENSHFQTARQDLGQFELN
jgi:hypothetical protein